jgi:capsule polysaccharide export protein KpsE/RkpR
MMTNVGMFKDVALIKKLKKKVREAQGELSIIKAIGNNSPEMKLLQKEVDALKSQLHTDRAEHQKEFDRVKKENNDCYNRIAELTEINKEHQTLNGKQHSELEIERKNHTLCREDNDLLNMEIGRMMKKLSK